MTEDRRQMTEVGRQRIEVGSGNVEVGKVKAASKEHRAERIV
jgi:hypothetical protein